MRHIFRQYFAAFCHIQKSIDWAPEAKYRLESVGNMVTSVTAPPFWPSLGNQRDRCRTTATQ